MASVLKFYTSFQFYSSTTLLKIQKRLERNVTVMLTGLKRLKIF